MTDNLAVELARAFTKALEEAQPPGMVNLAELRRSIESKLFNVPLEEVAEREPDWIVWKAITSGEAATTRRKLERKLLSPAATFSGQE